MTSPACSACATTRWRRSRPWHSGSPIRSSRSMGCGQPRSARLTGTLKIGFDPAQTRTERLLRALESAPLAIGDGALRPAGARPGQVRPGQHGHGTVGRERFHRSVGVAGDRRASGRVEPEDVPRGGGPARQEAGRAAGALHDHRRGHAGHRAVSPVGRDELDVAVLEAALSGSAFQLHGGCWAMSSSSSGSPGCESAGGVEVEVPVGRLSPGDLILVSRRREARRRWADRQRAWPG